MDWSGWILHMGWLGCAVGAFAFSVFVQSMTLHFTKLGNGMLAFLIAAVPLGLALMAVLLPAYPANPAWAGILLYAFLCEAWMFVFTSTFSSVSANLVLHLRLRPMRRDEIDQLYDNRQMIRRRINWLGYIQATVENNGRLEPTPKGRKLAALFDALRAFFGHRH